MQKENLRKDHEELKKLLESVPGVKEHLESFSVRIGKIILKRRLEMGISQQELAESIRSRGGVITQATISNIESGQNVKSDTYDKVFEELGLDSFEAHFGGVSKRELVQS